MPRRYWPPPARCPDEPAPRRTSRDVADSGEADESVCPRLPSTENFRKINHNPLELARISAGVRSCDVGNRRGSVNVSTVVIVFLSKRLFRPHRWPDAACDRGGGTRL